MNNFRKSIMSDVVLMYIRDFYSVVGSKESEVNKTNTPAD